MAIVSYTPVHTDAARIFSACSREANIVVERFRHLEMAILDALKSCGAVMADPALQEALQDIDMIAQHIEAVSVVLDNAAAADGGEGPIEVEAAIRSVKLEVVARRLAVAMAEHEVPIEAQPAGELELF